LTEYETWVPRRAGEQPPHWVSGMPWGIAPNPPGYSGRDPSWVAYTRYSVPLGTVHRQKPVNYVAEEELKALEEISVVAREALGFKSLTKLRAALLKIDGISGRILGDLA
jgi:hypothetical protein